MKKISITLAGLVHARMWGIISIIIGSVFLVLTRPWRYFTGESVHPSILLPSIIFWFISFSLFIIGLYGLLRKFHYKIEYDEQVILFTDNEKQQHIIKISEITTIDHEILDLSSNTGIGRYKYHITYLLLVSETGTAIRFNYEWFNFNELKELYEHINKINPNVDDKFFKYFKFGMFEPPTKKFIKSSI